MTFRVSSEIVDPSKVIENCPLCSAPLDMTGLSPLVEVSCPACGVPLWARSIWNQYEILDTLGEGGMGTVYLARDKYLRRNVALKVLRLEEGSDTTETEKLADEARMTALVEHPNIIKIYNFGQSQGEFYVAMELLPGGSLHDRMHQPGGITEEQLLHVGISVAEGLEAALRKGLVHRDIKPANILFAEDGKVKLVDFGLATALGGSVGEGEAIQGTPYYIAPERLDQRPEDLRSDIYSLGMTLMHAISKVPPLDEVWPPYEKLKRLKAEQMDLAQVAPEVSPPTVRVINRMIAPDPADRFVSYEELLEHLVAALGGMFVDESRVPGSAKPRPSLGEWIKAGVARALPGSGK